MHPAAIKFFLYVHEHFPQYFFGKRVLDAGGGDINGNNRWMFGECEYIVNDVVDAPNVTVVAKTSELTFPDEHFDIIISSECFEHDLEYEKSMQNIVRMLKPNGLFAFSCASDGRPEHGTFRTTPQHSFTTHLQDDAWGNYYKNLNEKDVVAAIPCQDIFTSYAMFYESVSHDIYFVGFKKGSRGNPAIPMYRGPNVTCRALHGSVILESLTSEELFALQNATTELRHDEFLSRFRNIPNVQVLLKNNQNTDLWKLYFSKGQVNVNVQEASKYDVIFSDDVQDMAYVKDGGMIILEGRHEIPKEAAQIAWKQGTTYITKGI